jgi:DNA polymerase
VQAGLERGDLYVTNAVKHFKWTGRGKKRIHQKPSAREVRACKPWLTSEIAAIKPRVIVLMGATAAQSVFGAAFKVTQHRGDVIEQDGERYFITVHPSSVLRARDDESRRVAMAAFVDDLRRLAAPLHQEHAATH